MHKEQLRFQFPGNNTKENISEMHNLPSVLQCNVQPFCCHHMQKKDPAVTYGGKNCYGYF